MHLDAATLAMHEEVYGEKHPGCDGLAELFAFDFIQPPAVDNTKLTIIPDLNHQLAEELRIELIDTAQKCKKLMRNERGSHEMQL